MATSAIRQVFRDEAGQELAEMAMVLPFLLVVALGVVEFGGMFATSHTLTSIGREGANIAARGAPLDTVNALILENGAEIQLSTHGGAISSRIIVEDSVPNIREQTATGSYAGHSHIGNLNEVAQGLSSVADAEGASFIIVEVFYSPDEATPFKSLFHGTVPDTLYSRAVF